jgi:hypothetical protein
MKFTKKHGQQRMKNIRALYRAGRLTASVVAQYESLRNWTWARTFLSLEEAQEFCKRKGLNNVSKYNDFYKTHRNAGLHSAPDSYYKISLPVFFGKTAFLTLLESQTLCKDKGIGTRDKYRAFYKTHKNIGLPFSPERHYTINSLVFFGRIKTVYLPLKTAQAFCKRKGINSMAKYRAFRKTHKKSGLPSTPHRYYKSGACALFGKTVAVYLPLKNAQALCKEKGLNTVSKYKAFVKAHKNTGLIFNPNTYYGILWSVFFGNQPYKMRRAA